jgi:hypothetical protein
MAFQVEAHATAVALHFMYYNFVVCWHPCDPGAMAAGVNEKLWEIGDIVALIEAKEAERPKVRGSYKKQGQISN